MYDEIIEVWNPLTAPVGSACKANLHVLIKQGIQSISIVFIVCVSWPDVVSGELMLH